MLMLSPLLSHICQLSRKVTGDRRVAIAIKIATCDQTSHMHLHKNVC